jgi:predicted alpha/beta hydrolase
LSDASLPLSAIDVALSSIAAADGFALGATWFDGGGSDRSSVVVIASATGVKRRYYDKFARFLASRGHDVVTFDYRGIGDSRPRSLRGFHATMREWGTLDLSGVLAAAEERAHGRSVTLVAHSVGGQLLGQAENNGIVQRALFVGAQHGYWRHWSLERRTVLAPIWYGAIPVFSRVMGYFPAPWFGLGEELPKGVALEWAHWCTHRWAMPGAPNDVHRERFRRLTIPIHAVSVSDDTFAPKPAVDALLTFYERAAVTHEHVRPREVGFDAIGHFGYFRSFVAPVLWEPAARWIEGERVTLLAAAR